MSEPPTKKQRREWAQRQLSHAIAANVKPELSQLRLIRQLWKEAYDSPCPYPGPTNAEYAAVVQTITEEFPAGTNVVKMGTRMYGTIIEGRPMRAGSDYVIGVQYDGRDYPTMVYPELLKKLQQQNKRADYKPGVRVSVNNNKTHRQGVIQASEFLAMVQSHYVSVLFDQPDPERLNVSRMYPWKALDIVDNAEPEVN